MVMAPVFLTNKKVRMFERLGTTADEVARSLEALGIKGVRNTVRILNPIVRYAHIMRPDALDLNVMSERTLTVTQATGAKEEIDLPQAVVDFLEAFNRGAYPELEMRS